MDTSSIKKPHKFFKKNVNNNLTDMLVFSKEVNDIVTNNTGYDLKNTFLDTSKKNIHDTVMDSWHITYNIFEYENEGIKNIKSTIKELVIEACEYYGINIKEQQYMLKGHLNYYAGPKLVKFENAVWDNHGNDPLEFHGYYCINAEPSITYYLIDGDVVENENKNNLALLSQNGYHHIVGNWLSEDVRITIGYNVFPLNKIPKNIKSIPAGSEIYGWDPHKREYASTIIDKDLTFGQWIPLV